MNYIDAFVAAVPTADKDKYIEHAKTALIVFKEYGVLRMVENWGDDIADGETTSLPKAVKCKENETVVLSWIMWPSREVRDAGWEKIMADPRMNEKTNPNAVRWQAHDLRRIQNHPRRIACVL